MLLAVKTLKLPVIGEDGSVGSVTASDIVMSRVTSRGGATEISHLTYSIISCGVVLYFKMGKGYNNKSEL